MRHFHALAAAAAVLSLATWTLAAEQAAQGAAKPAASKPADSQPAADTRKASFESNEALTAPMSGWEIKGEAAIDTAKAREGKGGALKIAPGGQAVWKLRQEDGSGKVDLWVYDDCTAPKDPKAYRAGPRWGLVQSDGRMFTAGIIYTKYVGGTEGYTGSPTNGESWFHETLWLGVNRAPAAWHKWTFVFDAEKGLQVLHNDKAIDEKHLDPAKAGLKGFCGVVLFGDSGEAPGQTLWVSDVSVTLGGPVKNVPQAKPVAKKVEGESPWKPSDQKVVMYTKDKAPAAPKLEELPLKESITQYGITWTFEKPAPVGQFVNGDCYVVGPVTVKAINPKPLYGKEIPEIELTEVDSGRPEAQRVRNGFMLNPPAKQEVAYDSEIKNWFRPNLIQKLPVSMKPGDSLVSTISMPAGLVLPAQLRNKIQRGDGDSSPIRTAAVLACVEAPLPPDAFRPAYCDRKARLYYSHDLKRELLPTAAAVKGMPSAKLYVRFTQRPWLVTGFFGFDEPVENMPQYGLEYGRVVGMAALLLCTDLKPEDKETLLVNFVQVGIDHAGAVRGGHPGWEGFGGHGSGRKLPIVFAGLLLGDDELANVNKNFPQCSFGEDEQTAYGDCWTGAKVVFAGHRAIDERTGIARLGSGPYEHKDPNQWGGIGGGASRNGDKMSEGYRRCCTSIGWIAQALALHLMKAEKVWAHDAFFDYCDRWMFEDDTAAVAAMKTAANIDHSADWARQGQAWDDCIKEMWARHRSAEGMPPTDGWKKPHDDSYLREAIEKLKNQTKPKN